MFAQAIQARIVRETRTQSHVLIFKHDLSCRCVEENFAALTSDHGERERVLFVLELEGRAIAAACAAIWTFKDRLGNLVDFVGRVLDLDVQALIYVMCQSLHLIRVAGDATTYRSDTQRSR